MGVIVKREIIAYRCEVTRCGEQVNTPPAPQGSTWDDLVVTLAGLVARGWSLVLSPKLRSYCPDHSDRCWECTCRTHPTRAHLCTAHDIDTAQLVWDQITMPDDVRVELDRIGAAA